MISEAYISKMKAAIRRAHSSLDGDLRDDIESALEELERMGIDVSDPDAPGVRNAVKLWLKAAYEDDPAQRQDFRAAYNALRGSLMSSRMYRREQ